MTTSARAVQALELATRRIIRHRLGEVQERAAEFASLSDAEITDACRALISAPNVRMPDDRQFAELPRMDVYEGDPQALALAAEAFSRFPPARIERGTRLYDEQILTAVHLLRGALVQMDTGEGKTYAIAAAALALLRLHSRVYIVTANPYLAIRDAEHMAPFWQGCGARIGRGLPSEFRGAENAVWEADVVYTTLRALVHRTLQDEIDGRREIAWSAVLLDEADEVILDQGPKTYVIPRYSESAAKDWTHALQLASELDEEDVDVDLTLLPTTTLSPTGEAKVLGAVADEALDDPNRLQLLHEVELAYTAARVLREGHHYDIREGAIVTMNPATGWHTPGLRYDWIGPLAQNLGIAADPRSSVMQLADGMTILRRFSHCAGTSGTIVDEALDYALLLGLPPAIVQPRTPRRDGLLEDLMFRSEEVAHQWVVEEVKRYGAGRPILIATDTTPEAFALAARIAAATPPGVTVRAVSGETIAEEGLFEMAGEPGMTIVSTRAAGRGVDIALSPVARENGGAMLIAIGHATEPRLDRQLLGRVGRRGDPYTAQFVFHPSTALVRAVMGEARLKQIAATLMTDEKAISAKMLTKQVRRGQRRIRLARLASFAGSVSQGLANREAYEMLSRWRGELLSDVADGVPATFPAFVAERYVSTAYPGLGYGGGKAFQSATAAKEVAALAGRPEDAEMLSVKTVGQPPKDVRGILVWYLTDALEKAAHANHEARRELGEHQRRCERAALDSRLLQTIAGVARSQPEGRLSVSTAVGIALGASRISERRVARDFFDERLIALDAWLADRSTVVENGERIDSPRILNRDADMVDVVGSAARAIANPADGAQDDHDAIAAKVTAALEVRRADAEALDGRWEHWQARSPFAIASETIDTAAEALSTGLDQIRFRVGHTAPGARFNSVYVREVERLQGEIEAVLASSMCANALAGADPAKLDALFRPSERQISVASPAVDVVLPDLPVQKPPVAHRTALPEPTDTQTVVTYFAALRERLGKDAPEEKLALPALNWMSAQYKEGTLSSPDKVGAVYSEWRHSRKRDELAPPWRRRELDWYVRGYLAFLNERGLAAPLPRGVSGVTRSLLRRARAAVKATGPALGALLFLAAALGMFGLAFVPAGNGVNLSPATVYIEQFFAAGALSGGSLIALPLIGVAITVWMRAMLGVSPSQPSGSASGDHALATLAMLAAGLALARPWHSGFAFATLWSLVGCLAAVTIGVLVRNAIWQSEQLTQCRISAGIVAGCAAAGALPYMAEQAGAARIAAISAFTAVALLAFAPIRRAVIPATAIRADPGTDALEAMRVSLVVRAPLSLTPHLHALLASWVITNVVVGGDPVTRCAVAAGTYLAILFIWSRALSGTAADPERWQAKMRARDEAYSAEGSSTTLKSTLARARRRVIAAEMLLAIPILAVAGLLSAGASLTVLKAVPLGPATVFATVLLLDLGAMFVRSAGLALGGINSAPISDHPDENSLYETVHETIRHFNKKLGIFVLVALALNQIAGLVGAIELVERIAKWLSGLIG